MTTTTTLLDGSGSASTMNRLFAPQSVAVIGASESVEKAGGALFDVVRHFPGPVYPINPRGGRIGDRDAYASIQDVPGVVDLALIAVPAHAVPGVIDDCIAAGVGGAVICSGGFAESGAIGAELQERVRGSIRGTALRVLGPNTSGFIVPSLGLPATFMPGAERLPEGGLGIIAQSGGVNLATAFAAAERGIGISTAIGLGNAVDIGAADAMDYLAEDDATHAIAIHIEGVADGRALMRAIRRASAKKPVIAFKVGRADVGDFAQSHTGALAGNWSIARAGLSQAGAVLVDSFTDLVDAAGALSLVRLPPRRTPGIGIVTGQAGPALIIADELKGGGVYLPALSPAVVDRLGELLPPLTYQSNPVDTGRPDATFIDVIDAVSGDPEIDAIVVYALQEGGTRLAAAAIASRTQVESLVPIVMVSGGPTADIDAQRELLTSVGVPFATTPDRGATIVAALSRDASIQHLDRHDPATTLMVDERIAGTGLLDEDAGKELLERMGVRTPRRRACASPEEAQTALAEMRPPLVVKILDANVTHKSAAGGVVLGVNSAEQLTDALAATSRASTSAPRWLLEEQIETGVELIVGAVSDPAFGPVVVVGGGGTSVEWAIPPALCTAPLSLAESLAVVDSLPPALRAAIGEDTKAQLAEVVVAVGDFVARHPEILELDINPLRVTSRGLIALDAVVRLSDEPAG